MATDHDDHVHNSHQEERIRMLKEQARRAAGGQMTTWESETLSADQREEFWKRVMDFENAQVMTDFQRLSDAGVELPEPAAMDDQQLTAKLWEVIHGLARMRVFLSATDHLSDRELYKRLWHHVLREENPMSATDNVSTWQVDLLNPGDEADDCAYLKYYADEQERQQWLADTPGGVLPEHEDPPFQRDGLLPQAYDEASSDEGNDRSR